MHRWSGRGIIADTGYGVAGRLVSEGGDGRVANGRGVVGQPVGAILAAADANPSAMLQRLDSEWLDRRYLEDRIADGVIAVTHANSGRAGWAATVMALKRSLPPARRCFVPASNISLRSTGRRARSAGVGAHHANLSSAYLPQLLLRNKRGGSTLATTRQLGRTHTVLGARGEG